MNRGPVIRFNDREHFDVEAYCISGGWAKFLPSRRSIANAVPCCSS